MKSSIDLVGKLSEEEKKLEARQVTGKLISCDVVGLYPNIPLEQTMEYARNLLCNVNVHEMIIEDFMRLLKVYLGTNLCGFGGNVFQFSTYVGVPMGSPLSPLIGDLFMDHLDHLGFWGPSCGQVGCWYRYVDDVLCLMGINVNWNERPHLGTGRILWKSSSCEII